MDNVFSEVLLKSTNLKKPSTNVLNTETQYPLGRVGLLNAQFYLHISNRLIVTTDVLFTHFRESMENVQL